MGAVRRRRSRYRGVRSVVGTKVGVDRGGGVRSRRLLRRRRRPGRSRAAIGVGLLATGSRQKRRRRRMVAPTPARVMRVTVGVHGTRGTRSRSGTRCSGSRWSNRHEKGRAARTRKKMTIGSEGWRRAPRRHQRARKPLSGGTRQQMSTPPHSNLPIAAMETGTGTHRQQELLPKAPSWHEAHALTRACRSVQRGFFFRREVLCQSARALDRAPT